MNIAVVTPWFMHDDLWPDYSAAVLPELREGDELIIIDNASEPELAFATTRLETNEGFAGGSNAGLTEATADAVIFLNNDIALGRAGWLETIRAAIEPGVLVGGLRTHKWCDVDGLRMPYLDGWALAGTRDDLLDLGGFDATLTEPSYFSDNLLCLEARAAGMKLREVPVLLRHKENVTAGTPFTAEVRAAFYANQERYIARARELLAVAA